MGAWEPQLSHLEVQQVLLMLRSSLQPLRLSYLWEVTRNKVPGACIVGADDSSL